VGQVNRVLAFHNFNFLTHFLLLHCYEKNRALPLVGCNAPNNVAVSQEVSFATPRLAG